MNNAIVSIKARTETIISPMIYLDKPWLQVIFREYELCFCLSIKLYRSDPSLIRNSRYYWGFALTKASPWLDFDQRLTELRRIFWKLKSQNTILLILKIKKKKQFLLLTINYESAIGVLLTSQALAFGRQSTVEHDGQIT